MSTTCIRKAAWVAAWDATAQRHVYRRDIDVAWQDDRLVHVGPQYAGPAETEIDGSDLFVIPGLIDVHSHPTHESSYKGIREEHGLPGHYGSGLYERLQAYKLDELGRKAAAEVAYAELLASGVTTLADLSFPFDGWVDLLARSGLRAYLAPGYADATWYMTNAHQVKYRWERSVGEAGFAEALRVIDAARAHPCGRLDGMLSPAQIDTCTEGRLRDSVAAAQERNLPLTTHCAQSVPEFNTMVRRHGLTPVQWAAEIGLLGENTLLGHGIFLDHHSWLHWHTRRDLAILAETGTSVAHCPTPFARYGQVLENLGGYLRVGVNMALGTDTSPHNLLEEMRWAAVLARVAAQDIHVLGTADVFHAATAGGARALLREDLGRLAPGAKADVVLVDLRDVSMQPARDPLRSLVYTAAERAVRDVYVDGLQVVRDRKVLHLDREGAVAWLAEAQARMLADVPNHDYAGRSADEITPLSLPLE